MIFYRLAIFLLAKFLFKCKFNMVMYLFINNAFYKLGKARISVFDHGLLYGDGVFETLRTYNGRVFMIDKHINRLFNSGKALNIIIPINKPKLKEAIYSTIEKNLLKEAYIRVTITRGVGDIGYTSMCKPNLIIIVKKLIPSKKEIYQEGVSVITYNTERFMPKVKSTNCLPLVLAKKESARQSCFEAILVDRHGNVTEGTVSNVFFIKKDRLYTPYGNLLEGITRGVVVERAKKFMKVSETIIKKSSIYTFGECFLTSTTSEIVPVVRIDGKKINNGMPGRITKRIISDFKRLSFPIPNL